MRDHPPFLRLGINIDHVATLRNARGGDNPCPVRAALAVQQAGADGITAHLREDRRHIKDADMFALKEQLEIPLNFEMAATEEMLEIALNVKPHAVCLVPEKRAELTTEGGLDAAGHISALTPYVAKLRDSDIRVSLFVDPEERQLDAAKKIGASVVELHTGTYSEKPHKDELSRIQHAAQYAKNLKLECHAGHGLNFQNVAAIAAIASIEELNIGHFLMGEAMFDGFESVIHQMRRLMDIARFGELRA